jgi:hypothetical protein
MDLILGFIDKSTKPDNTTGSYIITKTSLHINYQKEQRRERYNMKRNNKN